VSKQKENTIKYLIYTIIKISSLKKEKINNLRED